MIGPLPNPSGRKTEITPQEKAAAEKLTLAMRYGQDRGTIFKWTAYWKLLSELRHKAATTLLLYRTNEFKGYFFSIRKNSTCYFPGIESMTFLFVRHRAQSSAAMPTVSFRV
jgi:hypothetical protein